MENTNSYNKYNLNLNITKKEIENLNSNINKLSLKDIEYKIKSINLNGLKNIFYILKKNDESFTTKKDHILVNLGKLSEKTIIDISNFIHFYEKLETEILNMENQINKLK